MLSFFPKSRRDPFDANAKGAPAVFDETNRTALRAALLRYIWSPCIWKDGKNKRANFVRAEFIAIDIDNFEIELDDPTTVDDLTRRFCDMWHIIGTTRNHQRIKQGKNPRPACDRTRVLFRLSRPVVRLADYEASYKAFANRIRGSDLKCRDGAHIFFPCSQIVSEMFDDDSEVVDVVEAPSEEEVAQRAAIKTAVVRERSRAGILTKNIEIILHKRPIMEGTRNNTCYHYGLDCARLRMAYDESLQSLLTHPTFSGQTREHLTEFLNAFNNGYKNGSSG